MSRWSTEDIAVNIPSSVQIVKHTHPISIPFMQMKKTKLKVSTGMIRINPHNDFLIKVSRRMIAGFSLVIMNGNGVES